MTPLSRLIAIHITTAMLAFGVIGPLFYMAYDREPPWVRQGGTIDPVPFCRPNVAPVLGPCPRGMIQVHWVNSPLTRSCPGTVQVEIISGTLIWPVLSRPAHTNGDVSMGQKRWSPPPWPLPRDVPPGKAVYRITSFWYCNWLQELFDWPISQVGPDLPFVILSPNPGDVK